MEFDGTLASLIRCYETDQDSGLHKTRFRTREHSARLCKVLIEEHGADLLAEVKARQILRWHEQWSTRGTAMAKGLVGKLRTIIRFGSTFLEDRECDRLARVLHGMRFKMPPPRTQRLSANQVIDIRDMAHRCGLHSIALAQSIQFECMFRQKDIIGDWIPLSEPGESGTIRNNRKWLYGLLWSEIDGNLILRHTTSKRQKDIEIDLNGAPMVMEEFARLSERPTSGPVIIYEATGFPYEAAQFRVTWRRIANLAGVPKEVFNMDTRAGAISEATDAGAPLEHVRHAATHSDTSMTQRYSRNTAEKISEVQKRRVEHRQR